MPILVGKAIKGLLQRASADLAKLQRNIQQHDLYLTYFLTQQVIEKCFKILISLKNSNFPKKHDLSELYEIVIQLYAQEPSTLNVISSYASSYSRLTEVYEDERYGMWFDEHSYELQEAQELYQQASDIYESTKKIVEA